MKISNAQKQKAYRRRLRLKIIQLKLSQLKDITKALQKLIHQEIK